MDDLWYEDELELSDEDIQHELRERAQTAQPTDKGLLKREAQGIIRVGSPRWQPYSRIKLKSGEEGNFWLVRLRFEIVSRSRGARFISVRCGTLLEGLSKEEPHPTVYDLYPKNLYAGEPRTVHLKVEPSMQIAEIVGIKGGSVEADIGSGIVQPTVVGYTGKDERAPYWDLRPEKYPLEGIKTFWLLVEQPAQCSGVRLCTRGEGVVQTHIGPFPIRPKEYLWHKRPSVVLK